MHLVPPLGKQALDRVRTVLLAAQLRRDRVPQLVELGGREAVHEGPQVEGSALHGPSDILGSRLGGHLPECRQTKKKVASQAALCGGAIVSCERLIWGLDITTLVDPRITEKRTLPP